MLNRRDFIKTTGALATFPLANSWAADTDHTQGQNGQELQAEPNAAQKAWMEMQFGMFIHWGVNTYHDAEWSDGTLDISKINPSKLDTDLWCRTAKDAGMKYIVPVTKHHDGFCIWDTKYTKYSIPYTPYKKDVLAELVNSAEKHGLKTGFYYSLWDRHEKSHDTDEWAYIDFMKKQLYELLTNYGNIVELWFDGFWKKQQNGWTKKITDDIGENINKDAAKKLRDEDFIQAWRNEGAYRWQMDHLYQFIKSIQPDCLVMNNATTSYPGVPLHPVDIRSGEKYTSPVTDRKVWNWLGKPKYTPLQIETTMSIKGNKQFPSGNWFWHASDKSVATREQVNQWRNTAIKMDANLLLNCGPDPDGRLRDEDIKVLGML